MKFKLNKQAMIITVLMVSLVLNTYQFFKIKGYARSNYYADNEFTNGIQLTCIGIEMLETRKVDELSGMAVLSSGISKSVTSYVSTSYYKENPDLLAAFEMLSTNLTNRTDVREVIEKNDLTLLIPALKKVMDFPVDKKATEELHYLVQKYTNI